MNVWLVHIWQIHLISISISFSKLGLYSNLAFVPLE